MKYLFILLFLAQPLTAQILGVKHEKSLWRDGRGTIEITDNGIEYTSKNKKERRTWPYRDIQHFDRISSKEFTLLSYEDASLLLGRDKSYRFVITEGELTDAVFQKIADRMDKPVTNREVPDNGETLYALQVKHSHTFGGCEGVLHFTDGSIYYTTEHATDTRAWRFGRDIQSVWSSDPYQLEIHVYENNRREFSKTRRYNFQLKEPLDQAVYRKLKLSLYELDATHRHER